jgi:hypothetical protein
MPWMNLFDYAESERRKEEGIKKVSSGSSATWTERALEMIRGKGIGARMTAETLRAWLGEDPPHPNAIGAAFNTAAKQGLVEKTGLWVKATRPEAHSRELREWLRIPPRNT